jgi:hypothetical protein
MKKFIVLLSVIFCSILGFSQQYTSVTATLTDSQGTVWANATYTIQIVAPFNNSATLQNQGVAPISPVVGTADASGIITVSLDDNVVVKPAGSTWRFTICPNANVNNCSSSIQVVTGASLSLSTQLSASLIVPNISANPTIYRAYNDAEVFGGQGSVYIRTTDGVLRGCNIAFCSGSGWTSLGSGGGGGSSLWSALLSPTGNLTLNMNNFTTLFNLGTTGSTGAAFDISDSSTNTGSNFLFRVSSGATSSANPIGFFSQGTTNGVQLTSTGIFSAVGSAQLIATQLLNTGAGIGSLQMGSNGSGSVSQANTVKILGNTNQLYVSENGGSLTRVLIGGLTCGTSVLQSTSLSGTPTCLNILGGNNTYTGANTYGGTQTFTNLTISGTCTGCSSGTSAADPIVLNSGSTVSNTVVNYFGNGVISGVANGANPQTVIPRAGTLSNLSCRTNNPLSGTQTYVMVVMKGLAGLGSITPTATTETCTMNSTNTQQCNDLNVGDGFTVAAQDIISIQDTPNNSPTATVFSCSLMLQ